MSFGSTRVAAFYDNEILKRVTGGETALTAVLDGTSVPLNSDGRRVLVAGTVMIYDGINEVQTWTITGAPTGGTFTPTVEGVALSALPHNASAAQVQAAIAAKHGAGTTVSGSAGGPFTVTFGGTLAGEDVGNTTFTNTFSGGTTPAIASANTTTGGGSPAVTQKIVPAPASGISANQVAGILKNTYEAFPETPKAYENDRAVAVFAHDCHFDLAKLTNYTGNAAAVKAAMTGAGNDRCANCTFS